jgi:hypothetical protein
MQLLCVKRQVAVVNYRFDVIMGKPGVWSADFQERAILALQ